MAERAHLTLGDRIRWAGWLAWMIIGLLWLGRIIVNYVLEPISVIFVPLAIAIVITYVLNPLVSTLERRGLRRGLGVAIIYVLFLAVLAVALRFAIPYVGEQVGKLIDNAPQYADIAIREFNGFADDRGFSKIEVTQQEISDYLTEHRGDILRFFGGVGTVFGTVVHSIITAVIGIILSIYLLLDLQKIQRGAVKAIPPDYREETVEIFEKIGAALGGFFRGQLLVASFVGVATAIGLSLVKLPFAVVIGLVAGIFNLIPLVGPFLAAIPAIVLGLLSGEPIRALWAVLVLLVVQQIDNHVISPNVMGRTVKLHAITVMLALLAGGTIAGIPGMLITIPAVATVKILASHAWAKREDLGVPEQIADAGKTGPMPKIDPEPEQGVKVD